MSKQKDNAVEVPSNLTDILHISDKTIANAGAAKTGTTKQSRKATQAIEDVFTAEDIAEMSANLSATMSKRITEEPVVAKTNDSAKVIVDNGEKQVERLFETAAKVDKKAGQATEPIADTPVEQLTFNTNPLLPDYLSRKSVISRIYTVMKTVLSKALEENKADYNGFVTNIETLVAKIREIPYTRKADLFLIIRDDVLNVIKARVKEDNSKHILCYDKILEAIKQMKTYKPITAHEKEMREIGKSRKEQKEQGATAKGIESLSGTLYANKAVESDTPKPDTVKPEPTIEVKKATKKARKVSNTTLFKYSNDIENRVRRSCQAALILASGNATRASALLSAINKDTENEVGLMRISKTDKENKIPMRTASTDIMAYNAFIDNPMNVYMLNSFMLVHNLSPAALVGKSKYSDTMDKYFAILTIYLNTIANVNAAYTDTMSDKDKDATRAGIYLWLDKKTPTLFIDIYGGCYILDEIEIDVNKFKAIGMQQLAKDICAVKPDKKAKGIYIPSIKKAMTLLGQDTLFWNIDWKVQIELLPDSKIRKGKGLTKAEMQRLIPLKEYLLMWYSQYLRDAEYVLNCLCSDEIM